MKIKRIKKSYVKQMLSILIITLLLFIIYVVAGALLGYIRQPKVKEDFVENVNVENFYSDTISTERATIIEENEEALLIRVKLINEAKEKIVLTTFDFRADESGTVIIGALMDAADRGVAIQVLVDGFSYLSEMQGDSQFQALASYKNVEFKVYNQVNLLKPWKLMGRMHDKYLMIDDNKYLLGGRNTFNYFLGNYQNYKNYDRDVLVISNGENNKNSFSQLEQYFVEIWNSEACKMVYEDKGIQKKSSVKKAVKDSKQIYREYYEMNIEAMMSFEYQAQTVQVDKITLITGGISTGVKDPIIWHTLEALMKHADTQVKIHTPYIICNDVMYDSLEAICDTVPNVMLMTNSAANNGNPFGAGDYLEHKDEILETGISIWEYEGGVSYHGKSILIDDDISIIGSLNVDMRSVYLDTELMLVIDSKEINHMLQGNMEIYETEARQTLADGSYYNPYQVTPVEFTEKRKIRVTLVRKLLGWARYLF